jgi:hypothetical protein
MSYSNGNEPSFSEARGAIALRIKPHEKDLGEFTVRRRMQSREAKICGFEERRR